MWWILYTNVISCFLFHHKWVLAFKNVAELHDTGSGHCEINCRGLNLRLAQPCASLSELPSCYKHTMRAGLGWGGWLTLAGCWTPTHSPTHPLSCSPSSTGEREEIRWSSWCIEIRTGKSLANYRQNGLDLGKINLFPIKNRVRQWKSNTKLKPPSTYSPRFNFIPLFLTLLPPPNLSGAAGMGKKAVVGL